MIDEDTAAADRSALRDLIQSAMDNRSPRAWTLADLARESGLNYNSLRAWLQPEGVRSLPRPENLDRVADALRLPRAELRRAAQRAAGYVVSEAESEDNPRVRVFLATLNELTPEAQERLMRQVQLIVSDPELFPRKEEEEEEGDTGK